MWKCLKALSFTAEWEADGMIRTLSTVGANLFPRGAMAMPSPLPTALTLAASVGIMVVLLSVRTGHESHEDNDAEGEYCEGLHTV